MIERAKRAAGSSTEHGKASRGTDPAHFRDARRVQESFSAAAERKALAWLALRVPPSVNSDHLTVLGFTAMFLAGVSYAFARKNHVGLILAACFLAVNWLGDSLDGTLGFIPTLACSARPTACSTWEGLSPSQE